MTSFIQAILELTGIFAFGVALHFLVGTFLLKPLGARIVRLIIRSGWFSALLLIGCSGPGGSSMVESDGGNDAEDPCAICDCYAAPECLTPALACACPAQCVTGPVSIDAHASCAYEQSNDGVSYFCCE